jgi:hypothetical protein
MRGYARVATHQKLHHEDPSGFWKLIRTGESLPVVGQQILFVYDIRGTSAELWHKVFTRIANGDPYRITNDQLERDGKVLGGAPGAMLAETFKLPTEEYRPSTHVDVVEEVGFDEVMQEHWIAVRPSRSMLGRSFDSESIIYWAPFPTAPDTYTERQYQSDTDGLRTCEQRVRDRWAARKSRRAGDDV